MAKATNSAKKLERLETVLAIYGSDPAGWPKSERAVLERLVGAQPSAARLLDEAVALDKVMERAPAGHVDDALKQRIVAAAVADGSSADRVIPFSVERARRRGNFPAGRSTMWPAAALAASFALGLYLGISELGTNAVDQALEFASLDGLAAEVDEVELLPTGNGSDQDSLL